LDIPNAPELLAMFLLRAVVDDLLPPAFLSPDSADVELAKEILLKVNALFLFLSFSHSFVPYHTSLFSLTIVSLGKITHRRQDGGKESC
jgi:hypothetical protein